MRILFLLVLVVIGCSGTHDDVGTLAQGVTRRGIADGIVHLSFVLPVGPKPDLGGRP